MAGSEADKDDEEEDEEDDEEDDGTASPDRGAASAPRRPIARAASTLMKTVASTSQKISLCVAASSGSYADASCT